MLEVAGGILIAVAVLAVLIGLFIGYAGGWRL
jgi:hypothetical protein